MSRPPLVLVPQFFGSLVFDRRSSRYLPFDAESTAALRSVAAIGIDATLAREADAHRRALLQDFHEYFYDRGFFTFNGRLAAEILEATPPRDHLLGPLALHLEVIGACNLTCSHCFAGVLPRNRDPLTVVEMDRLFADLAGMGCFRLGLTGGEPLMRKDLFEIIDAATDRGLHPCLTTNGLLITEPIARELGRRELVWLNVSLDGATAETNDRVRGEGTFDRVLERLAILREHARFTLAFTVMSTNAAEIEACADLARRVGAHTAVFRPLYPVGVARSRPELMPTFGEYTGALLRLERAIEPSGDLRAVDPFSPRSRAEGQAKVHAGAGCGAANRIASVSVRGDVNPCSFLGSAFDAENIRDRSFAAIWSTSPVFAGMRRLSRAPAEGAFAGGCRARALAFEGDIDRPDPWQVEHQARADRPLSPGIHLDLVGIGDG